MPSQTDLDQGGTHRQWVKQYLGPSVGWVSLPNTNVLQITVAGTYQLNLSTSLVEVNVVGAVTIILPSAQGTSSLGGTGGTTAGANPGVAGKVPITIVDIAGNASAHPITIQPISNTETIMGLASIQITINYGGFTLEPIPGAKTWNSISP